MGVAGGSVAVIVLVGWGVGGNGVSVAMDCGFAVGIGVVQAASSTRASKRNSNIACFEHVRCIIPS
jgi:hypothetical protein